MSTNTSLPKKQSVELQAASFFNTNPRDYVKTIPLERPGWVGKAYWGVSQLNYMSLLKYKHTYLHPSEEKMFAKFRFQRRKEQFLRGRYAAKRALALSIPSVKSNDIAIKPGVFQQPIVRSPIVDGLSVSIAHSGSRADSLWFPREHPMAIDVELLRSDNPEAIRSQLTNREYRLKQRIGEDDVYFFTRLWTIKEALSKVLMTGLTTSLAIYEVEDLIRRDGFVQGSITHFEQYQAVSIVHDMYMCSLVLPKNTNCFSVNWWLPK